MRGMRYTCLIGTALAVVLGGQALAHSEAATDVLDNPAVEAIPMLPEAGPVLAAPETEPVSEAEPTAETDSPSSEQTAAAPSQPVQEILAQRLAEVKENADLAKFYAARGNEPIWIAENRLSEKALGVIERLRRADEDGLDPSDFILPDLDASADSAEQLATAEITLSRAVAAFARQAQGGRLVPSSLSPNITPEPSRPSRADVLTVMAAHDEAADWLDTYNPPHAPFKALKAELAKARARANEPAPPPPPEIAAGKSLKPDMQDDRVPVLRVRLGLPEVKDEIVEADGVRVVDNRTYDEALIAAVKTFQERHGLNADGILGAQTTRVLNAAAKIEDPVPLILVNMERWRWLPRDLGKTHIFVNIPEFMGRIVRDDAVVHETRIIVGTEKNQTPVFSDEMDHIVVNPAWNVPFSIASKEMLPNLQRDPYYLARQGFEVIYTGDKKPVVIDSTRVDWTTVDNRVLSKLRFRQLPGERNALGHIKFMFPNKHAVYLHDTPTRHLFSRDMRAFSHGCVRVQDPFALADVLLEGTDIDTSRFKGMIGGTKERRINLVHKIPIHLTYFTAETVEDGSLLTRPDIYGLDRKMKAALELDGRAQASARH